MLAERTYFDQSATRPNRAYEKRCRNLSRSRGVALAAERCQNSNIPEAGAMMGRTRFFNGRTRFLETGADHWEPSAMNLRTPPEPAPPPVKEPAREPEDPHAPLQEPDPDPIRP